MFTIILILNCLFFPVQAECNVEDALDESLAEEWLNEYNRKGSEIYSRNYFLWWDYYSNMSDYNLAKVTENDQLVSTFGRESVAGASCFNWKKFTNPAIKRQFKLITGDKELEENERKELSAMENRLEAIYLKGQVCGKPDDPDQSKCYELKPDLQKIFSESRNWNELLWAWKGWRDATGKLLKDKYTEHIPLMNKRARLSGYSNEGEKWKSKYESESFEEDTRVLFEELMPLYRPLHTYVREKLKLIYPNNEFPGTGHIPAHILGDMWAQDWTSLLSQESIIPYPGRPRADPTNALKDNNFSIVQIYQVAETFFKSLGFDPLPQSFWDDSVLEKQENARMKCSGTAWDFYTGRDFRIMFCTGINHQDFNTVHHEMGHIYYFMEYKDQPIEFRDGANPAVHEAIGDLILLSASTPAYLHSIGLINSSSVEHKDVINYLMMKAMNTIAFLPYGYIMDQWRWDVFSGEIGPDNYNRAWWDLRCGIQGISPPIVRSEQDFDPGAKYHIAADVPYIRYFLSSILMFQYQKALCDEANFNGPLHECNLYGSVAAGNKLREMLRLGLSKTFPESLMLIANTTKITARPLVEYFQPLIQWLEKENEGLNVGWVDECPKGSFYSSSSNFAFSYFLLFLVLVSQVI